MVKVKLNNKMAENPEFKQANKILFGGDSDLLPIAAVGQNTIVILVNNNLWGFVKISRVISVFLQRDTPKIERIREFIAMYITEMIIHPKSKLLV